MRPLVHRTGIIVALLALLFPVNAPATDVDGPDDCLRQHRDFGDAPEGIQAYPGIIAAFPTCLAAGPTGTQERDCAAISTPPGPAGDVRHLGPPAGDQRAIWIGCPPPGTGPMGVDSEGDGKVNDDGSAISACNEGPVDCKETAYGLSFGQDECFGDDDAGLLSAPSDVPCQQTNIRLEIYNCSQADQVVFLNVLIDWNKDGDWNDNFFCDEPAALCAYEWAVVNQQITVAPGCNQISSVPFLAGPQGDAGWMRVTVSQTIVPDDFPWNGSLSVSGETLFNGETEDYPLDDGVTDQCPSYNDYGDAPEAGAEAYPGIKGNFPTCTSALTTGTQEIFCGAASTPPGPTGYVLHSRPEGFPQAFWIGCSLGGFAGVDGEMDGKMNDTGGGFSQCLATQAVDCVEVAPWGVSYGQDECLGDTDAGLLGAIEFPACDMGTVTFEAYNCSLSTEAFLNILIDWNQDGDWNDNVACGPNDCAYEWAVKNVPVGLATGCNTVVSPQFRTGPNGGDGWMRITLTERPVTDDFPWDGNASDPLGPFQTGETEDYPITIAERDTCPEYIDYGDAPEEFDAYPGKIGFFPTCTFASGPGTQSLDCPLGLSTAPGITGFVRHRRVLNDPLGFWLGCGGTAPATLAVDGEQDGKSNSTGGANSFCFTPQLIDCVESFFGMNFGQDECYGGIDAGIVDPIEFNTCESSNVTFQAYNCKDSTIVYLNILVDWNEDADWNDNFFCDPTGPICAPEWAVKNHEIVLPPGCHTLVSPNFLTGPFEGRGWLRITLSEVPANDDFPWAGTETMVASNKEFRAGETEDYPVVITTPPDPCDLGYLDYGDAPEGITAYSSGVVGRFPTCQTLTPGGTQELECDAAVSTPPGAAVGYVRHLTQPLDADKFWLGCLADGEADGLVTSTPFPLFSVKSSCDTMQAVHCIEGAFGLNFGQDECYGDPEAALGAMLGFGRCSTQTVDFLATNCATFQQTVYLNILVDWNEDGDWNDNLHCLNLKECAYEWAVKNVELRLDPGCNSYTSPKFLVGPYEGEGWMRITLTREPVNDDFPWAGSATEPTGGTYFMGETEDYPIRITPSLVSVDEPDVPHSLWFGPLSPNPSSTTTMLRFTLPTSEHVTIDAFDVNGRRVRQLLSHRMSAGQHVLQWDFRDDRGHAVPVGLYLVKLRVNDQLITRRAIRIR